MRIGVLIALAGLVFLTGAASATQRSFEVLGAISQDEPAQPLPGSAIIWGAAPHSTVDFATELPAGSVIVRTDERRLYYVLGDGRAVMYGVGVGREGYSWSGRALVSRKAEWPDWRPPREMIEREASNGRFVPAYVRGGPGNPLGARAIYIGDTEYRIHGTSQPWSIGMAVSSGCIRMLDEEVIDLYERVQVGSLVVVE